MANRGQGLLQRRGAGTRTQGSPRVSVELSRQRLASEDDSERGRTRVPLGTDSHTGRLGSAGKADVPSWVVLSVTCLFLFVGLGRYWDNLRRGSEQASHSLYQSDRRHVAFLKAKAVKLDSIIVRDGVFAPVRWTRETLPYIEVDTGILASLARCDLAERMGKPCRSAQATYAASELAGAILYYGPGNEAGGSGACWQAPHRAYRKTVGNFTVVATGGRLAISGDAFRDQYRKGSRDFVPSDTFCSTVTGISTATNYWDDFYGDILGCSITSRKGPGFVPLLCRVDSASAVGTEAVRDLTLLDVCFGIDDILETYNGTTLATRCVEEESLNACGGVEPQKPDITYVLEVPAYYMRYRVYRVQSGVGGVPSTVNSTAHVSFIQWFPPEGLPTTWLLVSDCVVMQPLCNDDENNCNFLKFSDYLKNATASQCISAFFVEKTFFYVEPAYKEAVSVVVKWGGITLVRFSGSPPASACSSLSTQESAGAFVVVGDILTQQRPAELFAMLYDVQDVVTTGIALVTLGGTCVGTKISDGSTILDMMAGIRIAVPQAFNTHEGTVLAPCDTFGLPTAASTRYAFRRWLYGDGGQLEKNLESEYCTSVASHRNRTGDCHCCRTQLVQGDQLTDLGVSLCLTCLGLVSISSKSGECLCQVIMGVRTVQVWEYVPGATGGVVLPFHGTCTPRNVTIDEIVNGEQVYHSLYACTLQNNNCALGYTLYAVDGATDMNKASRFACFIDPPSPWAIHTVHNCPGSASAATNSMGGQWYAHCKGSCSYGLALDCWAMIGPGFYVDGGMAYKWGAVVDWMDPGDLATRRMGNLKLKHYVCWKEDDKVAWVLANTIISSGCTHCWKVFHQRYTGKSPGEKDLIYQKCYNEDDTPRMVANM